MLLGQRPDLLGALVDLAGATVVAVARDRAEPETAGGSEGLPPELFRCWPERGPGARERREADIAAWFSERRVDLVVAAGWLWLLSPHFLEDSPTGSSTFTPRCCRPSQAVTQSSEPFSTACESTV